MSGLESAIAGKGKDIVAGQNPEVAGMIDAATYEKVGIDQNMLGQLGQYLGADEFRDLSSGVLYQRDGHQFVEGGKDVSALYKKFLELSKMKKEGAAAYASLLEETKAKPSRAANIIGGNQTSLLGG